MDKTPDWFEDLRAKRQRWVAASDENGFKRGIWNATVAKYADPTHFIFELLQNAEDEGATLATFRLDDSEIVFEHDGEPFISDDVDGITGLGNTTKLDEANKIGRFGIGFKSVFVVTAAPEVHAIVDGQLLAFAIHDLVVPERIAWRGAHGLTRIVLPLPPETGRQVVEKVRKQLRALGPRTMLFLEHLQELTWSDGADEERYGARTGEDDIRRLTRTVGGQMETQSYLMRSQPVRHADAKQSLAVKIAFRLNAAGEIVRETDATRLSVYFETEEKPGFQFQVHGPFELTDNRANVKRDSAWNTGLVRELANLLADSLPELRDRGLLTRSFLGVLPIARDGLEEPWTEVRETVVRAFKTNALAPAQFGGHAPSTALVRGPSDLRDFLRDEGLQLFLNGSSRRWSISGSQKNDREDQFLMSLDMPEWAWAEFNTAIWTGLCPPQRPAAAHWLERLDDEMILRFYALLDTAITRDFRLRTLPIVKLENGQFVTAAKARLPPADDRIDGEVGLDNLVRTALIRGPKGRRKEVIDFLTRLGVQEVSERDYVRALLDRPNGEGPAEERRHLQEMQRFLAWWTDHRNADPFKGKAFLRAEGVAGYVAPERLYIDSPFTSTGLAILYDGQTEGRDRRSLWSGYRKLNREQLLGFLRACGVEDRLLVEPIRLAYDHPLRSQFPGRRETDNQRADDHTIRNLKALLARKDPRISKLIWQTMSNAPQDVLLAVYKPNLSVEAQSSSSFLVTTLMNTAWIPDKTGDLRRPAELTPATLGDGFNATGKEAWLHAIRFGEEHRRSAETNQTRRRAAETIGLPPEVADHLAGMTPEDRSAAARAFLRQLQAGAIVPPRFPERDSGNPERRGERVAARAAAADPKTYDARSRSVRLSDDEVRAQAKAYLADLYTNVDGTMVCQGCHQAMPFNLPDGRPYFEAVACVADEPRELAQNHLALCPVCAAKWRHANAESSAGVLRKLIETPNLSITVALAGRPTTVRFVKLHLLDLRAALPQPAEA